MALYATDTIEIHIIGSNSNGTRALSP